MDIEKIVLVYPNGDGATYRPGRCAPYTLMRLASLVPEGIPVEIWDEVLDPIDFSRCTPRTLMGITSKTVAIDRAKWIAGQAKQRGTTVVVGGAHATLLPDEVAQWADAVVIGEAYFTWPRIIQDFADDKLRSSYVDQNWANLAGVATLTDRVLRLVDERRYMLPLLEITRGCPRDCTFCTAIRVSGRKMRHRPIDEVVDEIERRGLDYFFLTDDNFGLNFRTNPDYVAELFEALAKLPLRGWQTQSEMIVGEYPELLSLARRAHLSEFWIGFESVDPANVRELGGKSRGNLIKYKEIIQEIHRHDIRVGGMFVFGFDHDSPGVFEATWNFVRESKMDMAHFSILTPFPGTPQRERLIEENRLIANTPWSMYDTHHVTYYPKLMTVEQLRKGFEWTVRQLHNPDPDLHAGAVRAERKSVFHSFRQLIGAGKR